MKAHDVVRTNAQGIEEVLGQMIMCPACGNGHLFDHRWTFNGNYESPTFDGSMRVSDELGSFCHSYVISGKIQYLDEGTRHSMKGQTVELPDMDGI